MQYLFSMTTALVVAGVVLSALVLFVMILLRRVVPTNMVHIVQSTKSTTSYGRGKEAGNTYYAFPAWVPKIGVSVLKFPESIFQVSLSDYEAYDQARLPFAVDVSAFFRVDHAETAAQRVESFEDLVEQLDSVLKGAVRRILATNSLEKIMEARSELGQQFTDEVDTQIKEWGVRTVKTIEFMDLRDSRKDGSKVIHNIMAKEQSRIDRESRVTVAENRKEAELAEIDAQRIVHVQQQHAEQQVGIRTAEKEREVGIAREQSEQQVQEQAAITAEKVMAVKRVEQERKADIERTVAVTNAEAKKTAEVLDSEAKLTATKNSAEGIKAEGEAKAKAEELILLAPVTAQITLAKEIGENQSYQDYLITLEQVRASQEVGTRMAEAIGKADLKVISTGGSQADVLNGVAKLGDVLSPAGGASLAGMLAALAQTDEGKALLKKFTGPSNDRPTVTKPVTR